MSELFDDRPEGIIVCESPEREGVGLLLEETTAPEAIVDGIVGELYKRVADASQSNAGLSFEDRRRISPSEVERWIHERLEAEGSSLMDQALLSGAVEPIDLVGTIDEPSFYQGVKVGPGHVTAGLVLNRPDDVKRVDDALMHRRLVLVSGPSGAGKSALLWLSVCALKGMYRWYQITARAASLNAGEIIRFLRARRPGRDSPIALAFDEVGTANSDLWNVLVAELRGIPFVHILGSVRREDRELIACQPDTEFIDVRLDENLAETMWRKLDARRQTDWRHWREPFEASDGLMLEYAHILTRGRRLADIIGEQVRQRRRERRNDELAIIRGVAALSLRGGEILTGRLFELLDMRPEDGHRALSRLLDEHLVRESSRGVLGGLHVLRSRALGKASHDEAAFSAADTLWRCLPAATDETLPRIIQSILAEMRSGDEGAVLRNLAEMLGAAADVDTWCAILTGMGFATLERHVRSLVETMERHNVPRAHWWYASVLGEPGAFVPRLPNTEQGRNLGGAMVACRKLPRTDFRSACVRLLPEDTVPPSCQNLRQAVKFLSCLVPILGNQAVRLPFRHDFKIDADQDIRQVASLLSTARLVAPNLDRNLAQAFGGERVLLDKFETQTPWVKAPTVDPDGRYGRTVRSDLYHVEDGKRADFAELLGDICATLLALSPDSEAVACDLVDPRGQPLQIGDKDVISKHMPRENFYARTGVAWNIAFRQIFLAGSMSDNLTGYTRQIAALVGRTDRVFREFTEKWIRGEGGFGSSTLSAEIEDISEAVNTLSYTPLERPKIEATESAGYTDKNDSLGQPLLEILEDLIGRMNRLGSRRRFKDDAVCAANLAIQVSDSKRSDIWRAIQDPPMAELGALAERLHDVACILHEVAHENGSSRKILDAARKDDLNGAVHAAALYCRGQAEQRLHRTLRRMEGSLEDKGWQVRCLTRPIKRMGNVCWPAREIAVLVELTGLESGTEHLHDSLEACKRHLERIWPFCIVPVLNGHVLADLAMTFSHEMAILDEDFAKRWRESIESPVFVSEAADCFSRAWAACVRISTVINCRDPEALHPEEERFLSEAKKCFERNLALFAAKMEHIKVEYLESAHDLLIEAWNKVTAEFEDKQAGNPVGHPLCMDDHLSLVGRQSGLRRRATALRFLVSQEECLELTAGESRFPRPKALEFHGVRDRDAKGGLE